MSRIWCFTLCRWCFIRARLLYVRVVFERDITSGLFLEFEGGSVDHIEFGVPMMIDLLVIRKNGVAIRVIGQERNDPTEYAFHPIFIGSRVLRVTPDSVHLIMFP